METSACLASSSSDSRRATVSSRAVSFSRVRAKTAACTSNSSRVTKSARERAASSPARRFCLTSWRSCTKPSGSASSIRLEISSSVLGLIMDDTSTSTFRHHSVPVARRQGCSSPANLAWRWARVEAPARRGSARSGYSSTILRMYPRNPGLPQLVVQRIEYAAWLRLVANC